MHLTSLGLRDRAEKSSGSLSAQGSVPAQVPRLGLCLVTVLRTQPRGRCSGTGLLPPRCKATAPSISTLISDIFLSKKTMIFWHAMASWVFSSILPCTLTSANSSHRGEEPREWSQDFPGESCKQDETNYSSRCEISLLSNLWLGGVRFWCLLHLFSSWSPGGGLEKHQEVLQLLSAWSPAGRSHPPWPARCGLLGCCFHCVFFPPSAYFPFLNMCV